MAATADNGQQSREVENPLDALRDEVEVKGYPEVDKQYMESFGGDEVLVSEMVVEYKGRAPDDARAVEPADERESLRWRPVKNRVRYTKVSAESAPMIMLKRFGVLNLLSVLFLVLLAVGGYAVLF